MHIKKQPARRLPELSPLVASFVASAVQATESELSALLHEPCDYGNACGPGRWTFPKSDLFHWVPLLDKFDDILAAVIAQLWDPTSKLQATPFALEGAVLVVRVLHFTRLLLENCSSRNIFASYDRLKSLLVTDDMAVLEATLELLLIPARKLDSQNSLRNTFEREVSTDELAILAQLWLPFIPDQGEMEAAKFALAFREHHGARLASLTAQDESQVRYIKMLATSIFLMAQPEGSIDAAILAMSPTLISDTAKMITPLPAMPMKIEIAAVSILRSCVKIVSKWNEIIHSLNFYASHGPVATIIRNVVDAIVEQRDIPYAPMFLFAFLDFVGILAVQVELDNSFVNSGIIRELVRAVGAVHPHYYKVFEKVFHILDSLVHHYTSGFDSFITSDGIAVTVRQIARFIEESVAASAIVTSNAIGSSSAASATSTTLAASPALPHAESTLLQCLLRFVDKLLAANSADDRLRNLLEGPLFKSLSSIFAHTTAFTVEALAHAVSIVSCFIHNEPTSLAILQEIRVPQAMITALCVRIPANAELLGKVPYAFSASCLNVAGTDFFAKVDPIKSLCEAFLQVEMLKLLKSRSTAGTLGGAVDEFTRHHPQFREMVIGDIIGVINRIPSTIGALSKDPSCKELFVGCHLVRGTPNVVPSAPVSGSGGGSASTDSKRVEPILSQTLETLSTFIEGVVQTPLHAKLFVESGGVDSLLKAFATPAVLFDFTVYNESLSISHMLRVLGENSPDAVIKSLLGHIDNSMAPLEAFLGSSSQRPYFESVVALGSDGGGEGAFEESNRVFCALTSLLAILGIFRDLYISHSYTFAKIGATVLDAFSTDNGEEITNLLTLTLKRTAGEFGKLLLALDESLAAAVVLRIKADFKPLVFAAFSPALAQSTRFRKLLAIKDEEELRAKTTVSIDEPHVKNLSYLLFVTHRLQSNVTAIFGGLSKMLTVRLKGCTDKETADQLHAVAEMLSDASETLTDNIYSHEGPNDSAGQKSARSREGRAEEANAEDGLEFVSMTVSGIIHFLQVTLIDESISGKSALMNPMVDQFYKNRSLKHLTEEIQEFMYSGMMQCQTRGALDEAYVLAVRDILQFFAKLLAPTAVRSEELVTIDYIRNVVAMYCAEFFRTPLAFRRALGPPVIPHLLGCLSGLLKAAISADSIEENKQSGIIDSVVQLPFMLFEKYAWLVEESLLCAPEATRDLALILDKIISAQLAADGAGTDKSSNMTGEARATVTAADAVRQSKEKIAATVSWIYEECSLSSSIKLRLLASFATICHVEVLVPVLLERISLFTQLLRVEVESPSRGDDEVLAAGMLLCAQLVYFSTLPAYSEDEAALSIRVVDGGAVEALLALVHCSLLRTERSIDFNMSILYVLAAVTRLPEVHSSFRVEELLPTIIEMTLDCLTSADRRYRSMLILASIIGRHFVEVPTYLGYMMELELVKSGAHLQMPVTEFYAHTTHDFMMARGYAAYKEAMEKHFALGYNSLTWSDASECHLILKRSLFKVAPPEELDQLVPKMPSLESLQSLASSPLAGRIVETLMSTLMGVTLFPPTESAEANEKAEEESTIISAHFKRCSTIIMLLELVHSYPVCREAFLKSPNVGPFMTFLFDRMTPSGELAGILGSRVFVNESMWVSHLLDEICCGPTQVSAEDKKASLTDRVRLVVDFLAQAIKRFLAKCAGSISCYGDMSRAWCLAMTVFVLVNPKSAGAAVLPGPVQSAIVTRMLEKSFASLLSSMLRYLDAKATMAPMVSAKIIFVLEAIARIGNRLANARGGATDSGITRRLPIQLDDDEYYFDEFSNNLGDSNDDMMMDDDSETDEDDSDDDATDDSEDDDDHDDMEMDDFDDDDDDSEGYSSDGDMYTEEDEETDEFGHPLSQLIVRPPLVSALGGGDGVVLPLAGGGARSNIVATFNDIPTGGEADRAEMIQEALRQDPFGTASGGVERHNRHHHHHHHHYDMGENHDHDGGDYVSDMDEDDDEDDEEDDEQDGFSVDDYDYSDEEEMLFEEGQVMASGASGPITMRRVGGGIVGRMPGGAGMPLVVDHRGSFSSHVREIDVAPHPILGAAEPAAPRAYTFEANRMPVPGSSSMPMAERTWRANQEAFHSLVVTSIGKRWSQECRLYRDTVPIRGSAVCTDICNLLKDGAIERRDKALAEVKEAAPVTPKEQEALGSPNATTTESAASLAMSEASPGPLEGEMAVAALTYRDEGPDGEFLQALPFDMRREVLEQYFEERRRSIPEGATVVISEEFLNALPQDLRDDYTRLSQHEVDRYRRRGAGHRFPSGAVEVGNLFQELGPSIRDALVESVRAGSAAGASRGQRPTVEQVSQIIGAITESMTRMQEGSGGVATSPRSRHQGASAAGVRSSAIALANSLAAAGVDHPITAGILERGWEMGPKPLHSVMDAASLSTILRIYYQPLMTEHRTHMRLFFHLCADDGTRADLINMLIYVLEEAPSDMHQLDCVLDAFVALCKSSSDKGDGSGATSKGVTPRKRSPMLQASVNSSAGAASSNDPFGGSTFVVIQQRTLHILVQIAMNNDKARRFFTTESEAPWTIKPLNKRGGGERSSKASSSSGSASGGQAMTQSTKYPIVLLLACLDRSSLVQVPLLLELLLHLLQIAVGPIKEAAEKLRQKYPTFYAADSAEGAAITAQVQDILPRIPQRFISSLVRTVIQCELSPKAFNYSTAVFQHLALIDSVAAVILQDLSEMSTKLAESAAQSVGHLSEAIARGDKGEINERIKEMSLPSSSQNKLLRCIRTLSSTILKPLKVTEERSAAFDVLVDSGNIDWSLVKREEAKACWGVLFDTLKACLATIDQEVVDEHLHHVPTGILPVIEAYFWRVRQLAVLMPETRHAEEQCVFDFADANRVIVNTMIRASPSLLTSGAFILLTRMPRVLDFDNKRVFFRTLLHKKSSSRPTLTVHCRRAHVFEDSFHSIMGRSGEEVKGGKLAIKFHDEEGLDAGGVTREWFSVLSLQMFDPNYALFKVSSVDKVTYQPNRMSFINPDHLLYFAFVGRIIGKAIYDNRLLDCHFTRSFYKHILHTAVDFKDLEAVDPEYYKSLVWILENDITNVMELTFSVEDEEFGTHKIIELREGGHQMAVTEANKREYVQLITEYKLTTAIKPQIDSFLSGFHEIIPAPVISIFNEQELELLISGMPEIDVDDWKNNTEYTGYTIASPQIQWFWRLVRSFDQEYRAKLFVFVTGTSKVPLEGLSHLQGSNGIQKFQIHRDYGPKDRLPSAHTCFNQLDLPEYETYELLRDLLTKAINECSTGFGLV